MVVRIEPPHRIDRIVRGRGRSIGWSEWGDPAGQPVLFCTGAAMTSSLGFCNKQGVRLICIDRPGLGRSAPDPEKSFESWAADVAAVLEHLGVERPPVVGFSQGGPFALALAAHGWVSAVALVAAQDDFTHPETRKLLPPELQSLLPAIEQDRDAFEASFSARVDPEGMWNLVVGMSGPHDCAIYESPWFAVAYRRSLEEGFAQGPGGYVRDLTLAMGPWPFRPEAITVPVHLWYGLLDTSPSHSPDFGATLARRFPHSVRHTLEHEGGSILWTRGGEIVEVLRATSKQSQRLGAITIGGPRPLAGQVTLVDYDPEWPRLFEREAARIHSALGDRVVALHHVGSTSVPGLVAKPIIDLLLVVADSNDEASYLSALEGAGYVLRIREPDWHAHRVFKGPDTDVNLHVFSVGSSEIERTLLFRDRLRVDEADRALYARTKRALAARTWDFVQDYADAKSEVVAEILARAG